MKQEAINFEQFLGAVDSSCQDFIKDLHDYLIDNDCKPKFEQKSSGYFISYKHTKCNKSIANLFFRKKGLYIRIYGERANEYLDFLNTLP